MITYSNDFTNHLLDQACQIQQIPSPTFSENRRAAWVAEQFRAMHLPDLEIDKAGNVLARWPGNRGGSPLVISAHLDTVFPIELPLTLECDPIRISGPGIGDNSLGVSALLGLVELLQNSSCYYGRDIWLAATTCEEGLGNLRGIQAVADRFGALPAAYISLEGLGFGNILHRGLGVERLRVLVRTQGGHSWVDYGHPSAVHQLMSLGSQIAAIHLPKRPRTTLNIGRIEGGTTVNTIASQAWIEIDLRSEGAQALDHLESKIRQVLVSPAKDIEVEVSSIGKRPAGEIPSDHPLVRMAYSVLSDLGCSPRLDIASTEANIPLSLGYPAITLGLTTGGRAHTPQEYIDTIPFQKGFRQVVNLVERLLT